MSRETVTAARVTGAKVCAQCPWRTENQGTPSPGGFYTRANLTRLWGQIRRGGGMQSCHLTDPSHPDHLAAGCSENAKARECPGSVLLVLREVAQMADAGGHVNEVGVRQYRAARRRGLTREGLLYWLISRIQLGGVPFLGGPKVPEVDEDEGVDLPDYLKG